MSNKKIGNDFEAELCEMLSLYGFWCHNLAVKSEGQPADVIAARNGKAYLIDCKVCSNETFSFSRLEENQINSMDLWKDSGNGEGWFAVRFQDKVYVVSHIQMVLEKLKGKGRRKENWFATVGTRLEEWIVNH